jgi:uncharacterized membrane protein YidH (DUF202 family)
MKTIDRGVFWLETALALLSASLAVVTSFWQDWIEAFTGFEPDAHGGSLEWGLVATLVIVSVVASGLASMAWRRRSFAARPTM